VVRDQRALEHANGAPVRADGKRRCRDPDTNLASNLRVAGIRLDLDPDRMPRALERAKREGLAGRYERLKRTVMAADDDQAYLPAAAAEGGRGGVELTTTRSPCTEVVRTAVCERDGR